MDLHDLLLASSSDDDEANQKASDAGESVGGSADNANIAEVQEREVQKSQSPCRRRRKRTVANWLASLRNEENNHNASDVVRSEDNASTNEVQEREVQTSLVPSGRCLRKRKVSKLPSSSAYAGETDDNAINTEEVQDIEELAYLPPRRCRRRKVSKWPQDVIVVTGLKEDGMPTELKAERRMRKLAGLIARQRVSILLSSLDDIGRDEWSKIIKDYILPFLRFDEPVRVAGLQRMMRMIYKSYRSYKSVLVRDFVRKGLNPREKHPYILPEVWPEFVKLHETEAAKKRSEKFKNIRAKNKHDHCLGTAGYARAAEKWEKQDRYLAAKRIPNPWHKYPAGRGRDYLRGHGRLVISESEDSAHIEWVSKAAEMVSEQIVEKQAELESSGLSDTLMRDNDVLAQVLGPERTGRMRGVSSYCGWKYWPNCSEMYRKRKRSDVDMDKFREHVVEDVIDKLRGYGLDLPSNILPSVGAKYSSCGSAPNSVQLDRQDRISCPNHVEPVTVPTYCTLVSNPGGYQVDLARGEVFPQLTELNSVPVQDGYAVVRVDFVSSGYESFLLNPPPSDDITTLGEALFKSIQWRKCGIVISPTDPDKRSSEPKQVGKSARTSLKDIVSDFLCEQANGADENCASKDHGEGKKQTTSNRSSVPSAKTTRKELVCNAISSSQNEIPKCAPAGSFAASRPPKSNTKRGRQVGVKQQQQQQVGVKQQQVGDRQEQQQQQYKEFWTNPNPDFKFGERMLSDEDLAESGPSCLALHNYYMNAVAKNKNIGIGGRVPPNYFMRDCRGLTMTFEDLFDLLTEAALGVAALRVVTVYLIELCTKHSVPVRFLDPDALSRSSLVRDRAYSVEYLENCLMAYGKENYVMFAFNTGKHWVAVVIVPNWNKVLYLDSNRSIKTELDDIISVIDEAYEKYQSKLKKRSTKFKLIHATKVPCSQQLYYNNTCGFYAVHHMMLMMSKKNIDAQRSQDLDLTSMYIGDSNIVERISNFIVRYIINPKGKFHDPGAALVNNKQYMELCTRMPQEACHAS